MNTHGALRSRPAELFVVISARDGFEEATVILGTGQIARLARFRFYAVLSSSSYLL
jgi:hypothetical protein